jgi:hypothetical protein
MRSPYRGGWRAQWIVVVLVTLPAILEIPQC